MPKLRAVLATEHVLVAVLATAILLLLDQISLHAHSRSGICWSCPVPSYILFVHCTVHRHKSKSLSAAALLCGKEVSQRWAAVSRMLYSPSSLISPCPLEKEHEASERSQLRGFVLSLLAWEQG